MKRVRIDAPAKVNFHLDVGPLRSDGFHGILSLFQAVSLFDRMEWSPAEEDGSCRIEGDFPCRAEDNLIYKAVQAFRRETGFSRGVSVRVEKRIPSEAGLGGGSSDAAAALKAMAALSGITPGGEVMERLAAGLGSDVPFFLGGAAAAVTGRGEIVEPVRPRTDFSLVVVKPGDLSIPTGEAYAAIDRKRAEGLLSQNSVSKEDMINLYHHASPSEWPFFNTFRETFKNQFKPLEFIFKLIYDSEAVFAGLSGSGSAVYGVFLSPASAENAERIIGEFFPVTERINPLDSIPSAVVI